MNSFSEKNRGVGQRGLWVRVKIRFIALKIRAMSQYGGGMGGGFFDKKKFRQTPLLTFMSNVSSSFFKKILYNIVIIKKNQKIL